MADAPAAPPHPKEWLELAAARPRAPRALSVDLDAHNGLRGAAAVWVVIFHALLYSTLGVDFQGSSLMPLFFMLSGFSLTVVYGAPRGEVVVTTCCGRASTGCCAACCGLGGEERGVAPPPPPLPGSPPGSPPAPPPRPLNALAFLQNRLARVAPMYYVGTLLALPPLFYGFGQMPASNLGLSIGLSLGFVTTLVSPLTGLAFFPVDGPSWMSREAGGRAARGGEGAARRGRYHVCAHHSLSLSTPPRLRKPYPPLQLTEVLVGVAARRQREGRLDVLLEEGREPLEVARAVVLDNLLVGRARREEDERGEALDVDAGVIHLVRRGIHLGDGHVRHGREARRELLVLGRELRGIRAGGGRGE